MKKVFNIHYPYTVLYDRSVSSNTDLSSLIKGIFNSNPCVEPLYPKRDLPLVLLGLCKPPFEQLATCH